MSEWSVMPSAHYKDIANAIREKNSAAPAAIKSGEAPALIRGIEGSAPSTDYYRMVRTFSSSGRSTFQELLTDQQREKLFQPGRIVGCVLTAVRPKSTTFPLNWSYTFGNVLHTLNQAAYAGSHAYSQSRFTMFLNGAWVPKSTDYVRAYLGSTNFPFYAVFFSIPKASWVSSMPSASINPGTTLNTSTAIRGHATAGNYSRYGDLLVGRIVIGVFRNDDPDRPIMQDDVIIENPITTDASGKYYPDDFSDGFSADQYTIYHAIQMDASFNYLYATYADPENNLWLAPLVSVSSPMPFSVFQQREKDETITAGTTGAGVLFYFLANYA